MTHFAFPYQIDPTGRTATVSDDDHIRQLIRSLLATIPGERVNRPTFGSPAHNLVFAPNSPEEAITLQYLLQSALQQWLGDLILVEAITARADDSTLLVTVQYIVRQTQQRQLAQLELGIEP